RPAVPKDFNLYPQQEGLVTNLIMDGDIMEVNLTMCNHDKKWLMEQIAKQGAKQLKDVFLATIDNNDNLSVFINYNDFNIKKSNKLIGK
ncbi:MAG: YetF domain-containing protein, partial [Eubacteriaceae bacterium]